MYYIGFFLFYLEKQNKERKNENKERLTIDKRFLF